MGTPDPPVEPLGCVDAGEGPILLALHGALTNGRLTFGGVLPAWSAGRRVVACDRPGYELTPGAWGDVASQAARLRATVAELGGPVDLLACSFGGLVALRAVQDDPSPWRSVVLVEVPAVALCTEDMVHPQALLRLAEQARRTAADVDLEAAFGTVFELVDPGLATALRALVRSGDPGVSLFAEELDLTSSGLDRRRLVDAVSRGGPDGGTLPVLAVSGSRSHPAYRTFGACTAAALAGRHHVIEGAGHATHLHPAFARVLQDFLGPGP